MGIRENDARDDLGLASADGLSRIPRVSLHDAVLNEIRDMIIEGRLTPGQRINEGQLGVRLGVSRTPLREAIKTLASEGLVEIVPAKGAFTRRFSLEDIWNILEAIKVLEQAAAQLACARASDADLTAIVALHEEMMARYAVRDRLNYFKLNQNIHSALVRAAGNPVMVQTHELLQARIKRIRFIGNDTPDRWAAAVSEHEEMIVALAARDANALAEVVGRHLHHTLDRVRGMI